jgi:peptidoglycan-associated lipoprotein
MFFVLTGCSSARTPEPAASSANAAQPAAKSPVRNVQSQGSLEDLRRGTAPTTPKESPLKEVYFDFDRYDLRSDARDTLRANAEWLKSNPAFRVNIEGHCDERGTTEYNLALGAKRAQAAKDYLVTLGVSADRISTTSYGKEAQVCQEHSESCRQRNRRDRFVASASKPGV